MNLRVTRTFNLPDDLADALIERLKAAGALIAASHIRLARSDPQGHELPPEEWPKLRLVLDEWVIEGGLDPRLEQLREFVAPDAGRRARCVPERDPGSDGSRAGARRRRMTVDITVVADAEEAARLVAELLAEQARAGGSIVLTGGSTPRRAYELAGGLEPDWSRVELWWGDERCVSPDDERSNFGMAKTALLDRLEQEPAAIHRMHGELGREAGADEYGRELSGAGAFDFVLLGLGPDGHVASLFPNFPTLDVTDRDVIGSEAGHEPFVDRISLTLPRLCATRELLFLVAGADKADAVSRSLAGEPSRETPGSLARAAEGTTRAILDQAAAAKLEER
ncbi:MAG: 6-phosphogluconolactonase [Gaiellaceae bacterium]